ncbi:MAG: protein kinase domain-containing protein [Acidobacteriota bacterium]
MEGRVLSHYRVLNQVGAGGMGFVYRAEDRRLKRTVALKFLPADLLRDADARERFEQEAQAASRLDHPNICTIYE